MPSPATHRDTPNPVLEASSNIYKAMAAPVGWTGIFNVGFSIFLKSSRTWMPKRSLGTILTSFGGFSLSSVSSFVSTVLVHFQPSLSLSGCIYPGLSGFP